MSGSHAAIRRRDGRFTLHDLESRNGTFVRIRGEVELRPGDVILLGDEVFEFLI